MKEYKIKSIKKIGRKRVINLTVYKNHTFITENGIITHNCDYLSPNAQALLRGDIEAFSKNARFLFTGNYPDRIIEPLLQRLQIYNLDEIYQMNKKELAKQIFERLKFIVENEGIKYNPQDLMKLISAHYPSTRAMIIDMQKNIINGELVLKHLSTGNQVYDELMNIIKTRKYNDIRDFVNDFTNIDSFYSYLYNNLDKHFESSSIPKVVILLAEYYDMNYRAKNKKIPLLAMITKLIGDSSIKFKK
jgi:DNA polymerase III delta prime subunit